MEEGGWAQALIRIVKGNEIKPLKGNLIGNGRNEVQVSDHLQRILKMPAMTTDTGNDKRKKNGERD
jgi:hypothetical protein